MKFVYFALPTLPATLAERKKPRPIAHHTERWQRMITEIGEIAHLVEDLGFWGFAFPEHHLHTEGLEMGTVDDICRQLDALVENVNPQYFVWQGDQGLLPIEEVKRQIELFCTKVIPHYL